MVVFCCCLARAIWVCLVILGSIAFFSPLFLLFAANFISGSTGVELLEHKIC